MRLLAMQKYSLWLLEDAEFQMKSVIKNLQRREKN